MDVISIAIKKRQAIDGATRSRRAAASATSTRRSTRRSSSSTWSRDRLSEAAIRRSIELSATKYCPVNAMLSAGATVVHHRYRIASTGERPFEADGLVISTGPYQRPDVLA